MLISNTVHIDRYNPHKFPWGFTTFQECKRVPKSKNLRTAMVQPTLRATDVRSRWSTLLLLLHLACRGHNLKVSRLSCSWPDSNLQPFLSLPTGPVWALPLQCQLPLSQYNEFPLCQAVPSSQPKEWNKYQSHWQVSGAGKQGPHKGGMRNEAETAANLADVGFTGWGS